MGDTLAGISFTAIDFETANSNRGSVCAVGLAKVENGRTVDSVSWLIRPPAGIDHFDKQNVRIHGIREADVADALGWHASVLQIADFMGDDHLVAYNATFDASVMRKASEHLSVPLPSREFYCALKLAQQHLELPRHKLPDVVSALSLPPFKHHDAAADAHTCAEVVLAIAARRGLTETRQIWGQPTSAIGDLYPLRNIAREPGAAASRTHIRKDELPQPNASANIHHPLFGAVFCFTGDLETFTRADAMVRVAERGASCGNAVTKKTTHLVIGESNASKSLNAAVLAGSGKARKAALYQEAGQVITVLCERDFLALLDVRRSSRKASMSAVPAADAKPNAAVARGGLIEEVAPPMQLPSPKSEQRSPGVAALLTLLLGIIRRFSARK
ncbi:exonuclease domain-containing protein [Arthrobacter sp. MP_2.3]|uniref:exonuclease domain-containing protein n=1 Tax=Arthrobacter sp. MP_2.3 TaxID=3349633 RepID=UPI0038D49807